MTQPGIKLAGVQTPAGFPWAQRRDWDTEIGGDAATRLWLVPDASRLTLSGADVVSGTDRLPAPVSFTGGPSPQLPDYVASSVNGRPAIDFPVTGTRTYVDVPAVLPLGNNFTVLALVNLHSSAETPRRLIDCPPSGGARFYLDIAFNSQLDSQMIDNSSNSARATTPGGTVSSPGIVVALACWEEASKRLYLSADFGHTWSSGTHGSIAPSGGATDIRVGTDTTAARGLFAELPDLWIANLSIRQDATRLERMRSYYYGRYGLDFL